jgi:tRNA(fMet)-specific endonuclease VapC
MKYLLDTNACIAIINGEPSSVRARLQKALAQDAEIFVSVVSLFELQYGVAKSSKPEFNQKRLGTFLAGPIVVLPFDHDDAKEAGSIRAALERIGKPIGAYDLLIAGQARNGQFTVVTSNVSEFSRVKGLTWQNWETGA